MRTLVKLECAQVNYSQIQLTKFAPELHRIESTRKCRHKLYHLKCVMAGAYGKYYEELFGTSFNYTQRNEVARGIMFLTRPSICLSVSPVLVTASPL